MEEKKTHRGGRGLFIVLEGLDGAGKTTQANLLVDRLKDEGHMAIYLKEPTNGVWGQKIRDIAANGREHVTPEEELGYFISDREEDARNNILPALESGTIVVMDRYIPSNMAYQGALGFDVAMIREKNRQFPQPDIVLFLDIKPEDGLGRISSREGGANEGFEKIEFLRKVYDVFGGDEFDFMERVDANGGVEEIAEDIWKRVVFLLDPA